MNTWKYKNKREKNKIYFQTEEVEDLQHMDIQRENCKRWNSARELQKRIYKRITFSKEKSMNLSLTES